MDSERSASSPVETLSPLQGHVWTAAALSPFSTRLLPFQAPSTPYEHALWSMHRDHASLLALASQSRVSIFQLRPNGQKHLIMILNETEKSELCDESERVIHAIAWSWDPVRLVPILAFAGRSAVIHVWRLSNVRGEAEPIRALAGHGESIYSLAFHPSHPHILASTSYDDSTRVWNVLGEGKPLKQSIPNPIGSGGAGYALICVMAGEAEGGHAHGVISSAFHPTLPLLATSGYDQTVKIWPLPRLPPPKTSKDSRQPAFIIHQPLFSSRLSHDGPVNGVFWYNESTLLSHQQYPSRVETPPTGTREYHRVLQWEWRGLDLHFPLLPSGTYNEDAGDERPRPRRVIRFAEPGVGEGLRGMASQFSNSRSYRILEEFSAAAIPDEPARRRRPSAVPSWQSIAAFVAPARSSAVPRAPVCWVSSSSSCSSSGHRCLPPPPPPLFAIPLSETKPGIALFNLDPSQPAGERKVPPPAVNPPIPPAEEEDEEERREASSLPPLPPAKRGRGRPRKNGKGAAAGKPSAKRSGSGKKAPARTTLVPAGVEEEEEEEGGECVPRDDKDGGVVFSGGQGGGEVDEVIVLDREEEDDDDDDDDIVAESPPSTYVEDSYVAEEREQRAKATGATQPAWPPSAVKCRKRAVRATMVLLGPELPGETGGSGWMVEVQERQAMVYRRPRLR